MPSLWISGPAARHVSEVRGRCQRITKHNEEVFRLKTFWNLLQRTLEGEFNRSPWLELRTNEPVPITTTSTEPAIRMAWRAEIHDSWRAPQARTPLGVRVD